MFTDGRRPSGFGAWACLVVVTALVASCSNARTGTDARTPADAEAGSAAPLNADLCARMCSLTRSIPCGAQPTMEACVSSCLAMGSSVCAVQGAAYFRCLVDVGPSGATCDTGQPAIVPKPGVCMTESTTLAACLVNQGN